MTGERFNIRKRQPDWHSMTPDARTSWFISEMLGALTSERSYVAAMNGMLEMMSAVIHTDRMLIFECSGVETTITFELCKEGIPSLLGASFNLPRQIMGKWFAAIGEKPVALISDISPIESFSKPLYGWLQENNITDFMAAPFYSDDEIVGFLGAYNARVDESVNLEKLFSTVSMFIGTRIENRRLIKRLAWAGNHDILTRLLNRRGLEATIRSYHAEHPDEPCSFVLVDFDDFKQINDAYGHDVGDQALKATATLLKNTFPPEAIVGRNGGDEFLVALPGAAAGQTRFFAERLANAPLEIEHNGKQHKLTLSIGFARYPDHCNNLNGLHAKADAALYAVKLAGKAGFAEYSPENEIHYRARLNFSVNDILDNIPHSMVVAMANEEATVLYANKKFAHLLECDNMYEIMRCSGGSLSGFIAPEDRKRVLANFVQRVQEDNEKGWTTDFRIVLKSGAVKRVRAISLCAEINGLGKVVYSTVFEVDQSSLA